MAMSHTPTPNPPASRVPLPIAAPARLFAELVGVLPLAVGRG